MSEANQSLNTSSIINAILDNNVVIGGAGGLGGPGEDATGGAGGLAAGGGAYDNGLYNAASPPNPPATLTVTGDTLSGNQVSGGAGGIAGTATTVNGGNGGNGGDGGDGDGAGFFASNVNLTVINTTVGGQSAVDGNILAGGVAGRGGNAGTAGGTVTSSTGGNGGAGGSTFGATASTSVPRVSAVRATCSSTTPFSKTRRSSP